MLIRVLLADKEEGLFNADCRISFLLDAVKQKHRIARSEVIDLCSIEVGAVKELNKHRQENGASFFTLRELCLAVKVHNADTDHTFYIPVLSEYANNEQFLRLLNHKSEEHLHLLPLKLKHRSSTHKPPRSPIIDSAMKKSADKHKPRKRRLSSTLTAHKS